MGFINAVRNNSPGAFKGIKIDNIFITYIIETRQTNF